MNGPIRLFDFQNFAIDAMITAVDQWRSTRVETGIVLRDGRDPIPFIGAFQAIMASGKTPLMAATLARLGPAIVIWTSKNAAVIDQTYDNLRGAGKYAHLLPTDAKIMKGLPSQADWRELVGATEGLTIWVMTTASWNITDENKDLRNLRKPQPDWAGETPPWDQLRPDFHARPLWVVYDESHNQTDAQLDQLVDIRPYGLLTGTGTTRFAPKMLRFEETVASDPDFGKIQRTVKIETSDAVGEGLLKSEVRVGDANGDHDAILDAVVANFRDLTERAGHEQRVLSPRALYVVEESNTSDGSEPRPVAVWRSLVERGIDQTAIAMFTNTNGDLPNGLEKVTSIDGLEARHRHIIFNKALTEGWDDPENFILYFDGVTKDATRITQTIGRVLRQPDATHFGTDDLNAAYLHIACPDELFDDIVNKVSDDLRGAYGDGPKGRPAISVVRMSTARRVDPKVEASDWRLPNLDLVRPEFDDVLNRLRESGVEGFPVGDLATDGIERWRTIMLKKNEQADDDRNILVAEATRLSRNTSVSIREYFAKRLRAHNRFAANLVPTTGAGPLAGRRWNQTACFGSAALAWADETAQWVAQMYEERAAFDTSVNAAKATWTPGTFLAAGKVDAFRNAAHLVYPTTSPWLNALELEFARSLDAAGGHWSRNPSFGEGGYSIPLPARTGSSQRFFPDFVWWIDERAWVIDTTAAHLMAEKVAGKLVAISEPRVALVARGRLDDKWSEVGGDGWTLVVRIAGEVHVEHFPEASALFTALRQIP